MPFYGVHNEKPVQQSNRPKKDRDREGKKRRAIDLSFVSSEAAPRLRFSFEAKRMYHGGSVGAYLGNEGLGCFIGGEYGFNESAAGMLGYVQNRTAEEWSERIKVKMESKREAILLLSDPAWINTELFVLGMKVKRSLHDRRRNLGMITIYHSFLDLREI